MRENISLHRFRFSVMLKIHLLCAAGLCVRGNQHGRQNHGNDGEEQQTTVHIDALVGVTGLGLSDLEAYT